MLPMLGIAGTGQHRSWQYRDGHLFAHLDVLSGFDEQHRLIALRNSTSIWLDIGINAEPTTFPARTFNAFGRSAFYLGFEPLLDKYALNLSRGVRFTKRVSLGRVALPLRGAGPAREALLLPLAVADYDNQPASFKISQNDGCATLGTMVGTKNLRGWHGPQLSQVARDCGQAVEQPSEPVGLVVRSPQQPLL